MNDDEASDSISRPWKIPVSLPELGVKNCKFCGIPYWQMRDRKREGRQVGQPSTISLLTITHGMRLRVGDGVAVGVVSGVGDGVAPGVPPGDGVGEGDGSTFLHPARHVSKARLQSA